ncbi:MAG: hypothetical protein EOO45_25175 [Flavobacterium sp.]|nr:MAG: hypothetical protein EOO45_25175 [Flavobacterium sp.]
MKQILILTLIGAGTMCWAQQNVTGQIADQRDGKPLRGVMIATKNSVVLAASDAQGRFSFATSDPAPEIVITKKGYSVHRITLALPLAEPLQILLSENDFIAKINKSIKQADSGNTRKLTADQQKAYTELKTERREKIRSHKEVRSEKKVEKQG